MHKNTKNLINQKFEKLTVIEYVGKQDRREGVFWNCLCECGNKVIVHRKELSNGDSKSCGCIKVQTNHNNHWKGYEELSKDFYSSIKRNAKSRNIEFNISIEEITSHETGLNFAGTIVHSDVTIEIVDDKNLPVASGEVGIIRYRRSGMASGYYNNPAATTEFFKDGFFYPGDMGYLDSSGRLVLEGRSNEVINLGGVKMNPEVIDAIAMAQLGVIDCAAFSIPGPAGVEQLAIALVTDSDFSPENFEKAMAKKSKYPLAAAFLVSAIARNENGKILRSQLSEQYLNRIQ